MIPVPTCYVLIRPVFLNRRDVSQDRYSETLLLRLNIFFKLKILLNSTLKMATIFLVKNDIKDK